MSMGHVLSGADERCEEIRRIFSGKRIKTPSVFIDFQDPVIEYISSRNIRNVLLFSHILLRVCLCVMMMMTMVMKMAASALQWNESVAPLRVATVVDFGKNINSAIQPWTCSFLTALLGGTNTSTVRPLGTSLSLSQHMQTLSSAEKKCRLCNRSLWLLCG